MSASKASKSSKNNKNDKKDKNVDKEEEDKENKKASLKKIFPDTLEKTEKQIEGLKVKISKFESKMKSRVRLYY